MRLVITKRLRLTVTGASAAAGVSIAAFGYWNYSLKIAFHLLTALAIMVSAGPPAIVIHLEERRKRLIDDALPRLLDDVAESQEAGMTLLQALEESSRRKYGPITEDLKRLVAQLSWGVEFEKAFMNFAERIGTELSVRVTTLLLEAIHGLVHQGISVEEAWEVASGKESGVRSQESE